MVFDRVKAFLLGPEYITITGDLSADLEKAIQQSGCADGDAANAVVEVSLGPPAEQKRTTDELQLPPPPLGSAAFRCSSALGTQLRERSIAGFDRDKQVYCKHELSPLPFQPPVFHTYATAMLSGTFKVFQYVVTVMVALMVMQHAVDRYWQSSNTSTSAWQDLLFVLFISYPMITLMLVVLTNNENAVRRFMYYRLMSLQVIVDWENTGFYRMWFFTYFTASFILLLIYSFWAGWLTSADKTISVWPQMSIVAMQSLLLFMFWLNIVSMEEQLVPLNKVIENSPASAKELIQHCEVVKEAQLKAAITNAYKRKKAFKQLSHADQDREGKQLQDTGDSAAAFFDLNTLRQTSSKRRSSKEAAVEAPVMGGCCGLLSRLGNYIDDILWRKLYAIIFATSFWSLSMLRLHRSGRDRAAATLWPYSPDAAYFRAMSLLSGLCAWAVVGVEAYAIWFVVFANDMTDRDKYGILECKMCYGYQASAGDTCSSQPQSAMCWAAAKRGYCNMLSALTQNYMLNSTQVTSLDMAACSSYLP